MHTYSRSAAIMLAALCLSADRAAACVLCEQGACPLHAHVVIGGGEDVPLLASEFDPGVPAFQVSARWTSTATQPSFSGGTGAIGSPAIITWGVVPDGTPVFAGTYGNDPSNLIATFDGLYPSGGLPSDPLIDRPWMQLYKQVFDRWSELGGVSFVYEPNNTTSGISTVTGTLGVNSDIRIAGHLIDGEVPGVPSIVAINYFPNNADQVLDTANVLFYGNTELNSLRFRNTVGHEIGHALGFNHVEDRAEYGILMEPRITIGFDGPQFDDILALHRNYGDRLEKSGGNDTAATATQAGVISPGGSWQIGTSAGSAVVTPDQSDFISIDNLSDVDYYEFSVAQAMLVDVRLTPVGPSYGIDAASGDPLFVTSHLADLSLELLANSQTVGFANLRGYGFAETISGLQALPGVIYHAVARGVSGQVQMYRLEISAVPEPASALLMALGLAAFARCRRWRGACA
ncbi:hypothetical protein Pla175_18450 [Pirellulimonas nuda]|uniref:Peptidase metallopeptidase domain-containing protein n=1 Tax=Pirellulimonas nuda TaxID=2528009 RepID=A0A518DAF4_9BACT|nr:PEP-CTERM sorting domain-containing protein [Pirellulimonas nuda]QDU88467.1 hypothetical protein Pla175_18450 [Pirellulimonas nuda]